MINNTEPKFNYMETNLFVPRQTNGSIFSYIMYYGINTSKVINIKYTNIYIYIIRYFIIVLYYIFQNIYHPVNSFPLQMQWLRIDQTSQTLLKTLPPCILLETFDILLESLNIV